VGGDKIEKFFKVIGKNEIIETLPSGIRYSFKYDELKKELYDVLNSFLSKEIVECLEKISNYNLRSMLTMARVALSSGYLYPIERQAKWAKVRRYDFIKAVMLGNNQYYFPKNPGIIINLFENEEKEIDGNNLIRLRVLQSFQIIGENCYIEDIYKTLEDINYKRNRVKKVLQYFLNCDLIESKYYEGYDLEKHKIKFLKLTYSGKFYLDDLIKDIVYFENIKHSTYIDQDYNELVEEYAKNGITTKERIENRFMSTLAFLEALKEEEKEEEKRVKNKHSVDLYKKFPKIIDELINKFQDFSLKIIGKKMSINESFINAKNNNLIMDYDNATLKLLEKMEEYDSQGKIEDVYKFFLEAIENKPSIFFQGDKSSRILHVGNGTIEDVISKLKKGFS